MIVELIAVMAVLGHGTYLRMTTTDSFSEFLFPFKGYLRLVSSRRLNHGIFHHQDCGPKIPPWRYHHQPKGMNRQYPNGVLIHKKGIRGIVFSFRHHPHASVPSILKALISYHTSDVGPRWC